MTRDMRVLLLEDNEGHARLIQRALNRAAGNYEVQHTTRLADALEQLTAGNQDVALVDLTLPDSRGAETVAAMRGGCRDLPIVVLTSLADDEMALAVLKQGAQDYLIKDNLTPEDLERAIRYAIHRQQSYSEIQRLLQELQTARDLLERKNRRLSKLYRTAHRFVDNVSHEFRTPLTVVKEYVSIMRDGLLGPLNEEQRRFLDIVNDRADDLNHMVDDMLDVSKMEAGILSVYRSTQHLAEVVNHVSVGLQRRAALKDVELTIEIDEQLPPIYCDGEKVGRVIVNLVVNAIKFCGNPGQVRLAARLDCQRREVVVSVTDNGPGIHKKDLKVIFRRFKQLGSNPRGSTKGFGLGLSIAHELVALNLGEMSVESVLGQGSEFSFTVPLDEPAAIVRRFFDRFPRSQAEGSRLSLIRVLAHTEASPTAAEDVAAFLNGILRRHDLLVRTESCTWLLIRASSEDELERFFERASQAITDADRNRLGRPLPLVTMHTEGSWSGDDRLDELLAQILNESQPVGPRPD